MLSAIILALNLTSIPQATSYADLAKTYGSENLTDGEVSVGEGEMEPATILFPKVPRKTLYVVWKDAKKKDAVAEIRLHADDSSEWTLPHDISIGTSLSTLRKLNEKPFELFGFDWDYSGTLSSWKGGKLEPLLPKPAAVFLRLAPPRSKRGSKAYGKVLGEVVYSSDKPEMKQLDPRVYQIIVRYE